MARGALTLLQGGAIIDGTGKPRFRGDVLIEGDRIAEVGKLAVPPDAKVVDCKGMVVAPGFVDVHSHSDLQVIEGRREKLLQGVTTEVVGNCGFSAFPSPARRNLLHEFANGIFCGTGDWGWKSAREYLEAAQSSPTATVAPLVGHGTLRIAVAGFQNGPLEEKQVDRMEKLLDEALAAGAAGFSTGLMYAPGSTAPFWELERLCRVVAKHDKVYATHMRDYFGGVVDAIEEQLKLARATGVRLQISHLQVVGASNWGLQTKALDTIEKAERIRGGVDVCFDCYPYTAGSTVLTQILPPWTMEGGMDEMVKRLKDPQLRPRITGQIHNWISWRWTDIYISAVGGNPKHPAVGKNLAELAAEGKSSPTDVVFDLLIEHRGAVNMLTFNQSEGNLRGTLRHPLSFIGSDGFYVRGRPHPRLHGTFPRLLGTICREKGWMNLEPAIWKITSGPAERFRIKDRGRVAPGCFADITVFDPRTIDSPATYEEPEKPPVGIHRVFRNGKQLLGPKGI